MIVHDALIVSRFNTTYRLPGAAPFRFLEGCGCFRTYPRIANSKRIEGIRPARFENRKGAVPGVPVSPSGPEARDATAGRSPTVFCRPSKRVLAKSLRNNRVGITKAEAEAEAEAGDASPGMALLNSRSINSWLMRGSSGTVSVLCWVLSLLR